jgi:hypothetical protein
MQHFELEDGPLLFREGGHGRLKVPGELFLLQKLGRVGGGAPVRLFFRRRWGIFTTTRPVSPKKNAIPPPSSPFSIQRDVDHNAIKPGIE